LDAGRVQLELTEERRRLTAAQADAQEEKNRMMRHEIAPFGFITYSLASLSNSLAALVDSIPSLLVRQAGIDPKHAETVRKASASVGNAIADLADEEWVARRYDEYLAEVDQ
jgi:phage terminase Nu1 subunit (DNA packaging protein)